MASVASWMKAVWARAKGGEEPAMGEYVKDCKLPGAPVVPVEAAASGPRVIAIAALHADQIMFIEDGVIVERGSHLELLARGGKYRALYDLQVRPETDMPLMAGE